MRLLAALVFVLVSLFGPRAHAAEAALPETKLPNGLRVVLDENHRVPVVSVTVRYAVGAGSDPDDRNGLTELVTRMMAQKTQHVPENGFDDTVDRLGGSWGFESNVDDTEFYARIPSNALETAFWLFSDQMGFFKPTVDDATIAHQLQIFAAERGQRVANAAMGLVNELVPTELYPAGHPYRHVARAGDAAGLASLTPTELGAFVDKYFVPSNAVLVVVGDAKLDQVTALAQKWFGSIPAGTPPPVVSIPTPALRNEIHLDIAARVERPVVRMTWLTPAEYAPGDAELDVVAGILHGNRIARLSWELITKLKVAGEITTREASHRRGSTFVITATATPNHTAQQVADAIDDVLRTLQTSQAPSEDDMEGGLASALMERTLSMEASEYRARQLAAWMIRAGTADYWQSDMHRYETDPARVQGAAQRHLPLDKRLVVFVTPSATAPVSGQLVGRKVKSRLLGLALACAAMLPFAACGSPPKPVVVAKHTAPPVVSASVSASASARPAPLESALPRARAAARTGRRREHAPAPRDASFERPPCAQREHGRRDVRAAPRLRGLRRFPGRAPRRGPLDGARRSSPARRRTTRMRFDGSSRSVLRNGERTRTPDARLRSTSDAGRRHRPCIDILADVVQHPLFDPLEINFKLLQLVEQGQTARELTCGGERDVLARALFGDGHAYARLVDRPRGKPDVDKSEVQRVYDTIVDPSAATLVLAGAVDHTLLEHVARAFSAVALACPRGGEPGRAHHVEAGAAPRRRRSPWVRAVADHFRRARSGALVTRLVRDDDDSSAPRRAATRAA